MSQEKNEDLIFRYYCPACEYKNEVVVDDPNEGTQCGNCEYKIKFVSDPKAEKFQCHLCGYDDFYLVKDFNKMLGLLIFIAGAILSIWTYGLSLAVAAFIDWILYKKLQFLKVCYICDSEFRNLPISTEDKAYEHTLGDLLRVKREEWNIMIKEEADKQSN